MQSSSRGLFLLLAVVTFTSTAIAQPVMPKSDSTKKSTGPANIPKPYKDVITDKAITRTGFFKVHKVEDKYFFEIPDNMLGREILVVNRLSKTQPNPGTSRCNHRARRTPS